MSKLEKIVFTTLFTTIFFFSPINCGCSINKEIKDEQEVESECNNSYNNGLYEAAVTSCSKLLSLGYLEAYIKLGDTYRELAEEKMKFTPDCKKDRQHYQEIRSLLDSSEENYQAYLKRFVNETVQEQLEDSRLLSETNEREMRLRLHM